jgi:two-component system response regulator HydG
LNSDPKRLLFVDDELGIRETMPVILRRHGFTVSVAATVAQAIQEICAQEFEILLSDLNIENPQDGYLVVRAIREVNPNCVTIILTGHPGFDSVVQGIRHGVDDYVTKPAAPESLVALLTERLAERQVRQPRGALSPRSDLDSGNSSVMNPIGLSPDSSKNFDRRPT